jgi:phosphohistidine phosphatase SixA
MMPLVHQYAKLISTSAALAVFSGIPRTGQVLIPATGPAQIILIRHAEKPDDPNDPHLSPAGRKRAERFASFIVTNTTLMRFGAPVAVFATKTTKDDNGQRTQETVAPLAKALKLEVQTPFHGRQYAELAASILGNRSFAGKTVVICWNHEMIPELAAALGVTPKPAKWKGSVYDQLYVISYQKGNAVLTTSRYAD